MPSTAISAQGATLSVGSSAGSAKTISGVAVGNPTILTAAAHGFSNGDVVAIAALTGADAGLLNGLSFVVKNKTTNTFAVDVDTTGKTVTAGSGTATPTTWTQIINVKSFSGFDGQPAELETTNLDSTAKEFLLGLTDPGAFNFEIDYDSTAASHQALRTKQIAATKTPFKLTLPNGNVITFNAYVKGLPLSGGVDQVAKTSVTLRITGAITGLAGV